MDNKETEERETEKKRNGKIGNQNAIGKKGNLHVVVVQWHIWGGDI